MDKKINKKILITLYPQQWGSWINNSIVETDAIRLLNLKKCCGFTQVKSIQHMERESTLPCSNHNACLES